MSRKNYVPHEFKVKRVNACIRDKVNFISGTVAPVSSNKYRKDGPYDIPDIESLEIGLRFLLKHYGDDTILSCQPKYMGSRINMYLFRENHRERSYFVTRNGFRSKLDPKLLEQVIDDTWIRMKGFMEENMINLLILDGELLPWSAIGKGLIEDEFLPVDIGIYQDLELMKKYGFDEQLQRAQERYRELHDEYTKVPIKELNKKYGKQTVSVYKKQQEIYNIKDSKVMENLYKIYHEQMRLYADYMVDQSDTKDQVVSDTDENKEQNEESVNQYIEYKPFGILKICFDDGTESVPLLDQSYGQGEMYEMLRDKSNDDDRQLMVKINEKNFDDVFGRIKAYFNTLTYGKGFEGIMIKPEFVKKDQVPMLKCRNISYLTIIYGYDYVCEPKLTRLIKSKSTTRKIRQSIREFQLGMDLLKTNYHEILLDERYGKALMDFFYKEEKGGELDPRL